MANIPNQVRRIVEKYIQSLKENNIPIEQAILFGSYSETSDIDIAIVSDIFEGDRFIDRGKIRKINLSVSKDLEILPYNPQDFTIDNPFVKEIMETGIKIV
ncbi:MAG: nucleotidyltransferase domain-containing protein [Deltaproteobacteria bacterium]|nr:nucleotidyltransferase domain-containing protein [Deltaproteobacteria bacterium]